MVATSNTYIESKIQGHLWYQFCCCINAVLTIIGSYFSVNVCIHFFGPPCIDVFKVIACLYTIFFQTDFCDFFSYQGYHFLRIPFFVGMVPRKWVNFPEVLWHRNTEMWGTDYLWTRLHIREERNPDLHRCEHLLITTYFLILLVYFYEHIRHDKCSICVQVYNVSNHKVYYSRITFTKSSSFCMTTFSASLTNLLPLLPQSRHTSCYVSRPILAPPPPWLQKHWSTRIRFRAFFRFVISA
jgi:hypothetical protein